MMNPGKSLLCAAAVMALAGAAGSGRHVRTVSNPLEYVPPAEPTSNRQARALEKALRRKERWSR